ncbi:MerR family transcriptional regulator [Pontixanthobacter sp. CEM42]|uniref:MerR family transcriptional regulator n=1 Tax=Pontixanthobacter sp. CEM42 TaxID=2792077 RepID=UPI001AE03A9B|nr:MerR family transcriptional regulator [Pontixanthobacter sp. CEM42]
MSAQFDDGKDDGALRTIGEVSKALNIKTHVLRYWEQQFPMLEPLKRSGGRRYYRPEDVKLVEQIDQLVNQQGYTLKGAQQAIADGKVDEAPVSAREPDSSTPRPVTTSSATSDAAVVPAEVIAQLKGIRARLAAALEA